MELNIIYSKCGKQVKGGGGEKRRIRGGGFTTKGGKEIRGISRPLNPPPSSPPSPFTYGPFVLQISFILIENYERYSQFYHFHLSTVAPKNIWRPKYLL